VKISVDDVELYTLSTTHKNVIKNEIKSEEFDADMERRLEWVLTHKYDQCFKKLKAEWDIKLAELEVTPIPTDPDEYAELVFEQDSYKDRSERDAEQVEP
jgi:hypothetical protein